MIRHHVFKIITVFIICMTVVGVEGKAFSASLKVPATFSSIQAAIDAAAPEDNVQVAQGVYFEHITLKSGVVLQGGWNKDFSSRNTALFVTILDGLKEKGPVVTGADNTTLDGFTVIHGSLLKTVDTSSGSGIYCKGVSVKIINNIVRDNEPSGMFFEGGSSIISKNIIYNNAQAGIYGKKGADLQINKNKIYGNKYSGISTGKLPASRIEARNNIIYNNERSGVNAMYATGTIENNIIYDNKRAGIICSIMPFFVINNTVVGNGQAGLWVKDPAAVATIKNNIFTYNIDAGIRTSGKGYSYNLFFANGQTGECNPEYLWCVKPQYGGYGDENSYKRTHGMIADPLFVDAASHDYHLCPGSPAIDAGDRNDKFKDVYFPPSLGTDINDMGAFGGPFAISEKRGKNNAPQADAGSDQVISPGKRVILDGSASSDPDGDALTYKWTLVARPKLSQGKILRSDRVKTACKTDKVGVYTVQLVVTDKWGKASKPTTVQITTTAANKIPKANIAEIFSQISAGDTITLYGSASKDPDGDPLTYQWSLLFKPTASNASIAEPTAENSSFHVDVDGGYTIQLVVNDGKADSAASTVNISTRNAPQAGVRNVPEDYPTIQAAIDAAQAGDNIVVHKGVYRELLVIDKSINLVGKDWPVIDGGSQKGNKNTISIFYLGDRAGKIEGFVIKGGGLGPLGHGINIWDSSPEIYHNKITGNNHGMGIHGSPSLTGKTKVHGNLIFNNKVGIGNGKDSVAHLFNNRIFNNKVVGIGSRGKGAPRIEANYIYGNRLGIGAREVASPRIEGNYIFANTDGIVISPLSTIKKFAFKDIVINNNLIVNNDHLGINITSFNLSKVIITNNTVNSNNQSGRRIRGGGIILGYPQPATFTAIVENNLITNNKVGGLVKFIGSEDFVEPGADLLNKNNNVWNNSVDYLDCQKGQNSFSSDPEFTADLLTPPVAGVNGVIGGYSYSASAFSDLPAAE